MPPLNDDSGDKTVGGLRLLLVVGVDMFEVPEVDRALPGPDIVTAKLEVGMKVNRRLSTVIVPHSIVNTVGTRVNSHVINTARWILHVTQLRVIRVTNLLGDGSLNIRLRLVHDWLNENSASKGFHLTKPL